MDVSISIELHGFAPRQPVTLTATQEFSSGARYPAQASFMTDNAGSVYVTRQVPLSGTYDAASAMGLFWSAERLPGEARVPPEGSVMQPWSVLLQAEGADGRRADLTLERQAAGPRVTRQLIRTEGLVGTLFLLPVQGPHPSVLVVGGGGGEIDEYRGAMLASRGYAAFNLGYFGMAEFPRGLVNIPLEYFEKAIGWMRRQPWLRDGFLAVWGASRGGELALLQGGTSTASPVLIGEPLATRTDDDMTTTCLLW